MGHSSPSFTMGIEEEYLLVDIETCDLAHAPKALMDDCVADLKGQVSPEFLRCQIEVGSGDISAEKMAEMLAGYHANVAPGAQSLTWDGRSDSGLAVAAGVYLANVRAGAEQQTVKMSLVK